MKITIITVCLNSEKTIEDAIKSVAIQSYRNIEYIVIDGLSTDSTLDKLNRYSKVITKRISEKDGGIYDAMNKGISMATGDIIGILNSDDYYANSLVIEKVVRRMEESTADALFADLVYVRPDNLDKVVRYYSGYAFNPEKFAWGCMPPHPTFFVRRRLYDEYGVFRSGYKIAADYELAARMLYKHKAHFTYLPEVLVCMRTGGVSTRSLRNNLILNREIIRACAENGIYTNIFKVYSKYLRKIWQLFERPV